MGTTVLESGIPIQDGLHVYAHCLRGTPGGVALLAINNNRYGTEHHRYPDGGRPLHIGGRQPGQQAGAVERNGARADHQ